MIVEISLPPGHCFPAHVTTIEGPALIGRHPECDLRLPISSVSRKHARLYPCDDDSWFVEDLESLNGTLLNNERVGRGPFRVNPGDVIEVGRPSHGSGRGCCIKVLSINTPE